MPTSEVILCCLGLGFSAVRFRSWAFKVCVCVCVGGVQGQQRFEKKGGQESETLSLNKERLIR